MGTQVMSHDIPPRQGKETTIIDFGFLRGYVDNTEKKNYQCYPSSNSIVCTLDK